MSRTNGVPAILGFSILGAALAVLLAPVLLLIIPFVLAALAARRVLERRRQVALVRRYAPSALPGRERRTFYIDHGPSAEDILRETRRRMAANRLANDRRWPA